MSDRLIIIGSVELHQDAFMHNRSFQYAASFEDLHVSKGYYPIVAYESCIQRANEAYQLKGDAYILYAGVVTAGNIGSNPGDISRYTEFRYSYDVANLFYTGYTYYGTSKAEFILRPEWKLSLDDYVSSFDGRRRFSLNIELVEGESVTYYEEGDI